MSSEDSATIASRLPSSRGSLVEQQVARKIILSLSTHLWEALGSLVLPYFPCMCLIKLVTLDSSLANKKKIQDS